LLLRLPFFSRSGFGGLWQMRDFGTLRADSSLLGFRVWIHRGI